MLRRSFLLFFLLILTLPVQNQAPSLLFAYVITHGLNTQETIVMDALSGEIHYGFGIDENICPISVSPDGNWLVYNQDGTKNRMINLATSDIYPLDNSPLVSVKWSENGNWAAYLYSSTPNFIDVRAILPATEYYRVDLGNGWTSANDFHFDGDNLLTASIPFEANAVVFRSTNSNASNEQIIPLDTEQAWSYAYISPNGRYLLGFALSGEIYTLNLATDAVHELSVSYLADIYWLPNEDATLAYMTQDENGDSVLVKVSPEDSPDLDLVFPLILSPDGQSAVYKVPDAADESLSTLYFLDITTGESSEIAFTSSYSSDVRWLSSTQLVYRYVDPAIENRNLTDLYLYDAETQDQWQMTDSPDLEDRFDCFRG